MKVLLVNSPVIHVLEPWFDEPNFVRTALAHLAGFLRSNSTIEVLCLDAKFEKLSFEETLNSIKKINPDIIGFTAFTNEIKPSAYLAAKIKEALPEVVTLIGGAHVTSLPEITLNQFHGFDIAVVGEGEETLLELCNTIEKKESLKEVSGIVFREREKLIKTKGRPRILDQDSLPMPAWDLMPPAKKYFIQSVRGCPFNCVFCMNHNGKVARKRSVELVIEEILYLINLGATEISFGDELFSVDIPRTHALLDEMIRLDIGQRVKWDIQTHVAYVDDELLKKMKEANLDRCEMGVESGDALALKRMGKATNEKMILKSFRLAKKHKLTTGSFFLFGQPNETLSSLWKTIKLGIKINPTEPMIGTMVPYPGTEVSNMVAKNEGDYKLRNYDWDDYGKQVNGSLEFNNVSLRQIQFMQLLGYTLIFIVNLRFMDFLKFFWSYKTAAFNLLARIFFNSKSSKSLKPADYNETLASTFKLDQNDLTQARKNWKETQSQEIKRTKQHMPNLLLEQMPTRTN